MFGAHASPWTRTGSRIGGRSPIDAGSRPTHDSAVNSGGTSAMGIACIARSPSAIARIASDRRARHVSPTASSPGTASVTSHCASSSSP